MYCEVCRASRNVSRAQPQQRPQQAPTPSCRRNSRNEWQPPAMAELISCSVTALQTQTNMAAPGLENVIVRTIWSKSACPGACAAGDRFRRHGECQFLDAGRAEPCSRFVVPASIEQVEGDGQQGCLQGVSLEYLKVDENHSQSKSKCCQASSLPAGIVCCRNRNDRLCSRLGVCFVLSRRRRSFITGCAGHLTFASL